MALSAGTSRIQTIHGWQSASQYTALIVAERPAERRRGRPRYGGVLRDSKNDRPLMVEDEWQEGGE
jgi:hypothetical protein